MSIKRNGFNAGTSATNVTAANSGSGNGDAFTFFDVNGVPAAIQYDNARAHNGTNSARFDIGASKYAAAGWTGLAGSAIAVRFYVYLTALPGSSVILCRVDDSTAARDLNVQINNDGKVQLDGKGAFGTWAATTAIPTGQWIRVELFATKAGALKCAYYLGDSTTPVTGGSYAVASGGLVGTGTFGGARFGCTGTFGGASAISFWLDSVAADNAPTDYLGPHVDPASPIFRIDSGGSLVPMSIIPL